jgi:hypothetical protein
MGEAGEKNRFDSGKTGHVIDNVTNHDDPPPGTLLTRNRTQPMASAALAMVPTLILFLFIQKYMISGATAGAVKG